MGSFAEPIDENDIRHYQEVTDLRLGLIREVDLELYKLGLEIFYSRLIRVADESGFGSKADSIRKELAERLSRC